jgi:hypothetical protein
MARCDATLNESDLRRGSLSDETDQYLDHVLTLEPLIDFARQAFVAPDVDQVRTRNFVPWLS